MNPRPLLGGTNVVEEPAKLETLTRRYTEHATQFIRESAGSGFFLYLPHAFPHIPLAGSALLYFDNWDLQCARWNGWKLQVARHNSSTYSAAPAGGRHNYILPRPELYNLAEDPEESYDVAPSHPEIVAQIQARIEKLLDGFPEPVKEAYAESKARRVDPATPIGARIRPPAE
jgi:hypothetical protein